MGVVDFHRHVWPDELVEALERREQPPYLRGAALQLADERPRRIDLDALRAESCFADLDRLGIDVAVVSLAPTLGLEDDDELRSAYEDGIRRVIRDSRGRIVALAAGGPPRDFAGLCVGAGRLAELEALAPLLDDLERAGKLLFVHPGSAPVREGAPSWWVPVVEYPAELQAAYARWLVEGAERWPRLHVVFASLAGGAPFQLERLLAFGVSTRDVLFDRVYFETSSYGKRALELCLATFGVDQLLFGSDAPVLDAESGLDAVRSFGDSVASSLSEHNPTRVLA